MLGDGGAENQQGRMVQATSKDDPSVVQTRFVDGGPDYMANNEYKITFPNPRGDVY